MLAERKLRDPWKSFLHLLDRELDDLTELHCFGGFVVAECYGLTRATADIDVIEVRGVTAPIDLLKIAGKTSALARKYKVYLDFVTIATVPDDYASRLIEVYLGEFRNLRLMAFEPHDLALAKLERNQDHDRDDVRRLAVSPGLDVNVLQDRYQSEMRWKLGNPAREDLTLELWIEMIREVQSGAPAK